MFCIWTQTAFWNKVSYITRYFKILKYYYSLKNFFISYKLKKNTLLYHVKFYSLFHCHSFIMGGPSTGDLGSGSGRNFLKLYTLTVLSCEIVFHLPQKFTHFTMAVFHRVCALFFQWFSKNSFGALDKYWTLLSSNFSFQFEVLQKRVPLVTFSLMWPILHSCSDVKMGCQAMSPIHIICGHREVHIKIN